VSRGGWRLLVAVAGLAVLACSERARTVESLSPLPPDRREYEPFAAQHPGLREPNYLPFVVHRLRIEGEPEDVLVTCRWSDDRFPLKVAIEEPTLARDLVDEPHPTSPAVYVRAVETALSRWEQEIGPPVRFRRVAAGEKPDVRIRLFGEVAPTPEDGKRVLGMTPLGDACVLRGEDPATGRLDVALRDVEVRIYVADDYGLLTPEQVETVAEHELGHALGARSHSPLPGDLMHEVARDRLGARRLSAEDVNSFAALYALENGTVFARRKPGAEPSRGKPESPSGPPRLADKPWEVPARGLSLRLPAGWVEIPIDHGVAAVDGFAWDYGASLQVIVVPVDGIAAYLDEYGPAHFAKGPILAKLGLEIGGRRAFRFAVDAEASDSVEEVTIVELGKGRVLLVIGEAPGDAYDGYAPWFHAPLDSLEVHPSQAAGSKR
jgi:predicted Zn-dependent protease